VPASEVPRRNNTEPEGKCEQHEMLLALLAHLTLAREMGTAENASLVGRRWQQERTVEAWRKEGTAACHPIPMVSHT